MVQPLCVGLVCFVMGVERCNADDVVGSGSTIWCMVWYVVFHIIKMTCNRTIFSRVLDSFCQSEKIREHIIAGRDTLVIRGSHISTIGIARNKKK